MLQPYDMRPPGSTERLDVLVVGAGLSGIDAGVRLKTGSPGRSVAIFEARDAIGGTWDLFRYPGVRSDSDMATLGFPFRPWRGEKSIVEGDDIRAYIEDTAHAYGVDRTIRLRHRVIAADWSSSGGHWTVDYEADGRRARLTCAFLYMCSGYYDYAGGHAPTWPGQETFAGTVVHPQAWPNALDVTDKRVVVVGSGATAVTLVPALADRGVASVTMLQRSPTYIVSVPSRDARAIRWRRMLPARVADAAIRWKNIGFSIFFYNLARRRPDRLKRMIAGGQRRFLGEGFDMSHLTPSYQPWDQRLCLVPDGDLFRALKAGKATIETDTIERFTAGGLMLASGKTLPADIVVTATGLRMQMMGRATLSIDGARIDTAQRMLYRGAMLEGVPNFAFAVGYTNASWTLKCDLTARFVSRLLNHMARRGVASVTPGATGHGRADEPMIGLRSGYVERAAATLPRQGIKAPWRVHQNYARDFLGYRFRRLRDGVLRFEKRVAAAGGDAA